MFRQRAWPLLVWACGALLLLPLIWAPVGVYDEGITLAGAERVARGEWPYRDFWAMYPPGQFFFLAGGFKAFGMSMLTGRIYDLSIKASLTVVVALLVRAQGFSIRASVATWAVALLWIHSTNAPAQMLYPVYGALLWILGAFWCLQRHLESHRDGWLLACGALMSSAAWFRHDLAGLAAGSVFLVLLAGAALRRGVRWSAVLAYVIGVGAVGAVSLAWLSRHIELQSMVDLLLRTPAEVMSRYRAIPYRGLGSIKDLWFWLMPVLVLIGFAASSRVVVRKSSTVLGWGSLALSLTGVAFFNQLRVRSDFGHLLPVAMIAVTLLPGLIVTALRALPMKAAPSRQAVGRFLFAIALTGLIAVYASYWAHSYRLNGNHWLPPRSALPRAGYCAIPPDMEAAVLYTQAITRPDEPVYIGVTNHDQFIISDVIFYFLLDRPYPTRFHELHPGVTTRADVQRAMVGELEPHSTQAMILTSDYWFEPNETRTDLKVDILDNYVAEHFERIKTFGSYEIWLRKRA